ncbi:tripartite tricarboxylate transporter substrate binding protein [Vibrio sp. SM6]|uniref:Tripartite tricarboxylate transporter substrate binding protein n=1 Tax=Vibrio agarilyticus TaxID=2726741 RepID=A0A7X8TTR6_9VIBR|nr:tripartite tricarboxylate transporter substrate binding protein [Vibrio agarilyticus]NLS14640.1 tripartite tricarboxylate transporter substrate binding protein [Vibrio agarilyticus]
MTRLLTSLLLSGGRLASTPVVPIADYPARRLRLVVPFAAGGGTDAVGRMLARALPDHLGQSMSVLNLTGGAGALGMSFGANQRPDGYTLTLVTREIAALPQMGLMAHQASDFRLIRMISHEPAVVLVNAQSRLHTMHDLLALTRRQRAPLQFASTATPNVYLMALEKALGIGLNARPYNGAVEATLSVVRNHSHVTMVSVGEAMTHLRSGQLRALGVLAENRIGYLPQVPTLKEQGYGVITGTWRGIAAPKHTPNDVVEALGAAFDSAMESHEFIRCSQLSAFNLHRLDAQDFTRFVDKDTQLIKSLIEPKR